MNCASQRAFSAPVIIPFASFNGIHAVCNVAQISSICARTDKPSSAIGRPRRSSSNALRASSCANKRCIAAPAGDAIDARFGGEVRRSRQSDFQYRLRAVRAGRVQYQALAAALQRLADSNVPIAFETADARVESADPRSAGFTVRLRAQAQGVGQLE